MIYCKEIQLLTEKVLRGRINGTNPHARYELNPKVASAGAIKDYKSQMAWYNVVYGMCTQGSGQLNQHSVVHDRLRKVTGLLRLFPSSVSKRKTRNSAVSLSF